MMEDLILEGFGDFIADLVDDKILYKYNDGNYAIQSIEPCEMRSDVELNTKTLLYKKTPYGDNIVGFHDFNGFTFLGAAAWGDNEFPVFFIIYKVMAEYYIVVPPADMGNIYNQKTNKPIGNSESDRGELIRLAEYREISLEGGETIMDLCKKLVDSDKIAEYIDKENWLWA